jgi:hypothetical protein
VKKYQKLTIKASDSGKDTALNSGRLLLAATGGSALGAVFGMYSVPVSVILTGYGVHKGNMDAIAGGLGMFTGGAYKASSSISGLDGPEDVYGMENGMEGFNLSNMFMGAKERLRNWFSINKARVTMKPADATMTAQPGMMPPATIKPTKMGDIDQAMIGLGNPQYLMGQNEELIGETTEMTLSSASMGDVRADPANGTILLGMDAIGRIL